MSDRPILFSAPMVRALLAGTKTQTRRVIKPRRHCSLFDGTWSDSYVLDPGNAEWRDQEVSYHFGDRLWVRETAKPIPASRPGGYFVEGSPFFGRDFFYRADADCPLWADGPWKPSIFMPRVASRLTLTVTDVRVERLQDISEADAVAEGTPCYVCGGALDGRSEEDCHCFHRTAGAEDYSVLWEAINGPGSWEANPWVAAYTFTVARHNIDNPTGEA